VVIIDAVRKAESGRRGEAKKRRKGDHLFLNFIPLDWNNTIFRFGQNI
jgi:hypothetical protein